MTIQDLRDRRVDFVSTADAAACLAVSIKHVQRLILKGALPARKFGHDWRILLPDLEAFIGSTGPGF